LSKREKKLLPFVAKPPSLRKETNFSTLAFASLTLDTNEIYRNNIIQDISQNAISFDLPFKILLSQKRCKM